MAEFSTQGGIVGSLVAWLVASLFVYFAARIVIDRSSLVAALLSTFLGSLLAGLVQIVGSNLGLPTWAAITLAFASVALVIAVFFRTNWSKGAVIGIIAALLWVATSFLVARLF